MGYIKDVDKENKMVTLQSAKNFGGYIGSWFELHVGEAGATQAEVVAVLEREIARQHNARLQAQLINYREHIIA